MNKLCGFYKPYISKFMEHKRKELKLTQKEFAEKLAISARYYHDVKCGISMPSTVELILFFGLLTDEEILEIIDALKALIHSEEYYVYLYKIDFI